MSDNIVILPGLTTLDISAERVLNGGIKAELDSVFLMGWDKNGELYMAGSSSDKTQLLWLLRKAELSLLEDE